MAKIISGKIQDLQSMTDNRGWFIGHFIKDAPEFKSDDFEVKWGVHKKGAVDMNLAEETPVKSLGILIYGKFKLEFPDLNKIIVCENRGEYCYWDETAGAHNWEVLEDCLWLTIRWPSKRKP